MTLRRWTILSVILLVPGFVLQFLSRTIFVPEAGVIGGLPVSYTHLTLPTILRV